MGRVHQKEDEVFHSDDIKVRDNYQLRVNWVQVALIVEMTKKGAGSAQLVVLKGGRSQSSIKELLPPGRRSAGVAQQCPVGK